MTVMFDDDAAVAAVDLVGRTGATNLDFGYLHEDAPVAQAGWWAHAQYRGSRITVENQPGPVEALEALARRLLTGARCTHCQGLIALSDGGAVAHPGQMLDGTTWTEGELRTVHQCRWRRMGPRWERGCAADGGGQPRLNRAQRRRMTRLQGRR